MSDKVYCIVQYGDFIYVPVKAETNPYNGREAYLKGLPNFFGGTKDEIYYEGQKRKEKTRTAAKALSDELREESQNNINISEADIAGQLTADNMLLNAQVGESQYWFYLINIQAGNLGESATGDIWDFCEESEEQNENEMKCVVKVPIAEVINANEEPHNYEDRPDSPINQDNEVIDRFSNKVLSACSIVYEGNSSPQYFEGLIQDPQNQKVRDDWNTSETRKAFAKLAAVLYSRYKK